MFFDSALETVLFLDTDNEMIHLYSMPKGDKGSISYYVGNYRAKAFEKEFYDKLGKILDQYKENYPTIPMNRVSLVLPDSLVLTDSITVPTLSRRAMDNSVDVMLTNIYRNSTEIKFNRQLTASNKQNTIYTVVGVRRSILSKIKSVCAEHQVGIGNITFAANATVDGALMINPKLRNSSFVLLDIKDTLSRIIFVVKGRTVGFYNLPFGSKILYKSRVAAEDKLADHAAAELLVLNAKEKAKAKALTVYEDTTEENAALAESETTVVVGEGSAESDGIEQPKKPNPTQDDADDEDWAVDGVNDSGLIIAKRGTKKLPKFMLRPMPTNREGFVYENFRFFMKWVLGAIASNTSIISLGAPECVYVNLPEEYNFLYNMINEEADENGIEFQPLSQTEVQDNIRKNLDLYGAVYARQFNKYNNFRTVTFFADLSKKVMKLFGKQVKEEEE